LKNLLNFIHRYFEQTEWSITLKYKHCTRHVHGISIKSNDRYW
jgi:hypothetical protein